MRVSPLLLALLALALVAPTAGASPLATGSPAIGQDLRSPDARDADAAVRAQTLQDIARLHAGNPRTSNLDPKQAALLAQEQYYTSYGTPTPIPPRNATAHDDGSPWLTIGLGVGLTALVAGAVAFAVRTRRRAPRVRMA